MPMDQRLKHRLYKIQENRQSKLHSDEPVFFCEPLTVNTLRGKDALLEKLILVHGGKRNEKK
jgi:hypothetical protein